MSTRRPKLENLFLTLLLSAGMPVPGAVAQAVTGEPAEYMIYQYPDVALVVKVDVPEAEFSMRILGPDDALLGEAGVPGRRLGPVFHYLAPADLPRQLMIEVTPGRRLPRAAITMELIQLGAGDPNTQYLARAYRLFTTGTETAHSNDTNTWVVKTYSLRNAAEEFAALGMEEMRLWSEYFAAQLVLHRLGDRLMAMELAQEIQRAAVRAGFDRIELAALVLEGDALARLIGEAAGEARSTGNFQRAHAVFARVAELAERQQLASEHGRALYSDGQVFEQEGEPERALEQYGLALEVSAGAGNPDLLNELRNASAALQESLGRTAGAIEMLDLLAADLAEGQQGDAAQELADGLFEKGRLLNSNYRYGEAAVELERALELRKSGAGGGPWGPAGLELAWSLYSMGQTDEAASLLQEALPRTPLQGNRELLARAYGSLARISLGRGDFGAAAEARERQAELTGEGAAQAELLFSMGADARMQFGPGSTAAEQLLRRSEQSAMAAGDTLTAQRSRLQLCLLAAERGGSAACSDTESGVLYRALRDSGMPRLAAEAALARSRILRARGSNEAAWQEMNGLLDDLLWLRQALPGVLGAWYGEHRGSMVPDYLALAGVVSGQPSPGGGDGKLPLLALERVRMLDATADVPGDGRYLEAAPEENLRSLLARREAAAAAGNTDLAAEAAQALATARRDCAGCSGPGRGLITLEQLESLLAGLGRSEALLTYDFSGPSGRALLAGRGGVRAVNLSRSADILDAIAALRVEFARAAEPVLLSELESLGQRLLAPLGDALPPRVYLLPLGPLRGFPFDALRRQGRFLLEGHQVVNLAGLASLSRRGPVMDEDYRDRVFLAGDPRSERDPFSLEVVVSPEVAAVTDVFVGPGLHVVQGLALQKDEFLDDRFTRASLIHLAAPGRLDLAFPERSFITLSGATEPGTGDVLTPADVRAFESAAGLVVLSGTVVTGQSRSPVDSRMAFVADFLDAGAASIVVSLWTVGESRAASFAKDLYRHIEQDRDIESAFAKTRRSLIGRDASTNLQSWAGFQLFIR